MLLVKHIEWTNGHVPWTLTIQSKSRTTRKKRAHTHACAHRVEQKQLENPCAINDDGGGGGGCGYGDDDGMRDAFG